MIDAFGSTKKIITIFWTSIDAGIRGRSRYTLCSLKSSRMAALSGFLIKPQTALTNFCSAVWGSYIFCILHCSLVLPLFLIQELYDHSQADNHHIMIQFKSNKAYTIYLLSTFKVIVYYLKNRVIIRLGISSFYTRGSFSTWLF